MCHFFSLKKTRRPAYLFNEIPAERNVLYNLRRQREYQPTGRTVRFASTYFQNVLFEWNLLDKNIKDSNTLAEFKRKLLAVIRPVKKSVYNVYNMAGIRNLTKLRVKFSPLNEHRFRHNFDCLSPLCVCGTGNEDSEHFLLHCPQFDFVRTDLFSQLADVPGLDITSTDSKDLCELLLYGTSDFFFFLYINLKSYNNRTWLQDDTTRRMRIHCNPVALTINMKHLTFTRKYYSINYKLRKEMK